MLAQVCAHVDVFRDECTTASIITCVVILPRFGSAARPFVPIAGRHQPVGEAAPLPCAVNHILQAEHLVTLGMACPHGVLAMPYSLTLLQKKVKRAFRKSGPFFAFFWATVTRRLREVANFEGQAWAFGPPARKTTR